MVARSRTFPAGLVIALLVAALVTFAGRGLMGDAQTDEDSAPFFITRWHLSSATLDGVPVEITNDLDPWVFGPEYACPPGATGCSSGPMVLGNDTCNRFVKNVGLDAERVTWGAWGLSTLVGCPDTELQKTFERLRRGEGFMIELADDQLRMSGKDVNLIFVAGGPFARTEDPVLEEGAAGDVAYRVTWNGGITVESTDTSTASGIGLVGNSPAADTLSGFFVDLGGAHLLVAALPDAAATARYVTDDGQSVTLKRIGEGMTIVAANALFERDPGPGALVALDADGTELGSLAMVGAAQVGLVSLAE